MARNREHHHGFPRPIARFLQLEGGQYGTVEVTALTPHQLEVQLGMDFVRFNRREAEGLRDAVQGFLELGPPRPPPPRVEVVEEVADVAGGVVERAVTIEREVAEAPQRRRRGRRSS
jgi:hypothetical protein